MNLNKHQMNNLIQCVIKSIESKLDEKEIKNRSINFLIDTYKIEMDEAKKIVNIVYSKLKNK